MKIAMFTDTFLPNKDGVVMSILNQIKGMTEEGIEVIVFAPGEKAKLEYVGNAKVYYIKGLDFKKYPGYKIVLPTKFMSRLQAFLEVENPDVTFYSGYCIKSNKYNLKLLKIILNSQIMEYYINLTSKSYRNGYKSFAKSFLTNFSIPILSREDEDFLIKNEGNYEQINKYLIKKYRLNI
jgi:hypothetical protein